MNVLRTCYKYYKQRYLPTAQTRLVGNSLACWKLGYIAWNQCLQASVNLGSPRWPVQTDFGCSFSKHLPTVNPEWELANSQIALLFLIRDCTSRSTATIFPKCHIFSCVSGGLDLRLFTSFTSSVWFKSSSLKVDPCATVGRGHEG